MLTGPKLHLASASPRRAEILRSLGVVFTAAGVDADETPRPEERPAGLAARLAEAKARAARVAPGTPVLGADTVVVSGKRIFGKPASEQEALAMLTSLSGGVHEVLTAVAVLAGERLLQGMSRTLVRFRDIDPDEARKYWQSGEPAGKAGAYAIQGRGGIFVESISGSYSGVVGLPVFETARLLAQAGYPIQLDRTPGPVNTM